MALNSLLFYQFFVYISTKFDGGHNTDSGKLTPQLHGILLPASWSCIPACAKQKLAEKQQNDYQLMICEKLEKNKTFD